MPTIIVTRHETFEIPAFPKRKVTRLMEVCRVLRELPRSKKFDLDVWSVCGTAGCAVGWAASDPWFRRRGLTLRKVSEWHGTGICFRASYSDKQQYEPILSSGVNSGVDSWTAVSVFFDITEV
jgi:hypothetical protein